METLESRWARAGLPFGAASSDTGEFMLGKVVVTPVFLESNGSVDVSTENWDTAKINAAMARVQAGLNWWTDLLATKTSVHSLEWVIDRTYVDTPSPTVYEPINRVSNDYSLWTQEFLMRIGYAQSSSLDTNMFAFNNAQRIKAGADWSFTMFVINSNNDVEGTFAPGGRFNRAFAFPGGLFNVIPSTRDADTFAHETGHMFWARDEYAGGSSFFSRRGYYNTQNTNALDNNSTPGFQQANSIMSSGDSMANAYNLLVSPASTLAMVGWQDSDGDGIFDVLDVPLSLNGVGRVDVNTGRYRFLGSARVETLPNLNSEGNANDITLNRISRIEGRINGGAWQVLATPDLYETAVDVSIPLQGLTSGKVEIRAVDAETGITSNVFEADIGALPESTPVVGINGFAWNDDNANGLFDAVESGLGAQSVRLVAANGTPLSLQRAVDADSQVPGPISSTAFPGVVVTAVGTDASGAVGAFDDSAATTGSRVFRPYSSTQGIYVETWNDRRQLRIQFNSPTSFVSVDVIAANTRSYGRLELYNANGQLLDRITSAELRLGQSQNLELGRDTADIAYAIVRGHLSTSIKIDNFRYGPKTQTTTDAFGRYNFPNLPAGTYNVQFVLTGVTSQVTSTPGAQQSITLAPLSTLEQVNFGVNFQNTAWHNTQIAEDVNNDGLVSAIDALLVINLINQGVPSTLTGSGLPSVPYVDVSNDAFLTALDALLVINAINAASGEGENSLACEPGDVPAPEESAPSSAPAGEGELFGPFQPQSALPESTQSEGESLSACLVDQLASSCAAYEAQLLERLRANPWTLPQPCNCSSCLATDLASIVAR